MKFRRLVVVLVAVMAALIITACGGDESGDTGDDFASQADGVCIDQAEQLRDLALEREVQPFDEETVVAAYEEITPVMDQAQADLEAIEPPEDLSSDYEKFLSARADRIEAQEEAMAASAKGDSKGYEAATAEVAAAVEESEKVAAKMGFTACASILSEEDRAAVEEAEQALAAATDPEEICNEIFLPQLIEQAFKGDVEKCLNDPLIDDEVKQEYSEFSGVDGVRAEVTLQIVEGAPELKGTNLQDTWYYVDGEWRLYSSTQAG